MTISIVIADDHPLVLDGLERLFSFERDFSILARAQDGKEALRLARTLQPAVLVLDLSMPEMDGVAVLRALQQSASPTKCIVLTATGGDSLSQAVSAGARGIVLKDMAAGTLPECVRTVNAGGTWLDGCVTNGTAKRLTDRKGEVRAPDARLTPREVEVAHLSAGGLSNREVAARLVISEGTAKLHLHHVFQKLKVSGRVALSQYVRTRGID